MENISLNETENVKLFDVTKKDCVFIAVLTVASVLMSFLGISGGFRGGFTFSNILIVFLMTFFSFKRDYKFQLSSIIFLVEAVMLSTVFIVTSNVAVRLFSCVILVLVSFLLFFSFSKNEKDRNEYDIFITSSSLLLDSVIPNIPVTAKSVFPNDEKGRKSFWKVFVGIAASFPVLIVVIPLLMSSDEAFSGLIKFFGDNVFLSILKLILGLGIAFLLIAFCLTIKNDGIPETRQYDSKKIDKTVLISFLSSISVCYIAYLISQLAYFFSAFKGLLPSDYSFTMAGYARRGFFEMCIIAFINFCLIFCTLVFAKENNIATKILSVFICVFTLVIIATAISKMFLYIERFGMTQLRILTSAFMMFLAVMFIALIVKIFVPKILIIKFGIVLSAVVLIVLGTFNVNSFIAKYNYTAHIKGQLSTMDVLTIYELGDEGVPYLIKLTEDSDIEVSDRAKDKLFDCYIYDYYNTEEKIEDDLIIYEITEKKYESIGSFGISRNKAYRLLDKYLEENPYFLYDYIERAETYEY